MISLVIIPEYDYRLLVVLLVGIKGLGSALYLCQGAEENETC